jgi:hypothetical protein
MWRGQTMSSPRLRLIGAVIAIGVSIFGLFLK